VGGKRSIAGESSDAALREHRALALLQALHRTAAPRLRDDVLLDRVNAVGVSSSMTEIVASLHFLESAGLVRLEHVDQHLVAQITADGSDVALGHAFHDGVLRPPPLE
jgi:hypothetical protein